MHYTRVISTACWVDTVGFVKVFLEKPDKGCMCVFIACVEQPQKDKLLFILVSDSCFFADKTSYPSFYDLEASVFFSKVVHSRELELFERDFDLIHFCTLSSL